MMDHSRVFYLVIENLYIFVPHSYSRPRLADYIITRNYSIHRTFHCILLLLFRLHLPQDKKLQRFGSFIFSSLSEINFFIKHILMLNHQKELETNSATISTRVIFATCHSYLYFNLCHFRDSSLAYQLSKSGQCKKASPGFRLGCEGKWNWGRGRWTDKIFRT